MCSDCMCSVDKATCAEKTNSVTESQNCLVLPAPHKRASRPASDFTVLFY